MPWTTKTVKDGKRLLEMLWGADAVMDGTQDVARIKTPLGIREFKRGAHGGFKIPADVQRAVFGSYIFGRRAIVLGERDNGEQCIKTYRSIDFGVRAEVNTFSWANVVEAVYYDVDIHDMGANPEPLKLELEREIERVWAKQFSGDTWEIFAYVDENEIPVNSTDYNVYGMSNEGIKVGVSLLDFLKDPLLLSESRMSETVKKFRETYSESFGLPTTRNEDFEAFAEDFSGDAEAMDGTLDRLLTPKESKNPINPYRDEVYLSQTWGRIYIPSYKGFTLSEQIENGEMIYMSDDGYLLARDDIEKNFVMTGEIIGHEGHKLVLYVRKYLWLDGHSSGLRVRNPESLNHNDVDYEAKRDALRERNNALLFVYRHSFKAVAFDGSIFWVNAGDDNIIGLEKTDNGIQTYRWSGDAYGDGWANTNNGAIKTGLSQGKTLDFLINYATLEKPLWRSVEEYREMVKLDAGKVEAQGDRLPQAIRDMLAVYDFDKEVEAGATVYIFRGIIAIGDYENLLELAVNDTFSFLKGEGGRWICTVVDRDFKNGKRVVITVIEGGAE